MNLTDNISDSVTPVYNRRGNVVGCIRTIDGGRWLEKRSLNPAKHKLKRPPGWATDVKHIEELRRQGGVGMVIRTTDGEVLTATLDALDTFGFPVDRGHGPQTGLADRHWHVKKPSDVPPPDDSGQPVQLELLPAA